MVSPTPSRQPQVGNEVTEAWSLSRNNREHCSGNTYFKGEFPSNISPTVRVESLGFKPSDTDSILNGLSLNSCHRSSSPAFLPGPCPRLLIQQKT